VLLICSGSNTALGDAAAAMLGPRLAARIDEVRQHVPEDDVACALDRVRDRADGLIAIGGGSAVGLAKALAAALEVPIVAVPTTYSGSEQSEPWPAGSPGR
jgi:maleylacetate reductase